MDNKNSKLILIFLAKTNKNYKNKKALFLLLIQEVFKTMINFYFKKTKICLTRNKYLRINLKKKLILIIKKQKKMKQRNFY